ncbi:MAG: phage major capsid protein [Firmicutes bacterium HGW-Firmicutes-11]|jgi:HK97 family phage major capsid protein|nr:MAG: phage major capsid protein [Firmicutes bacterium HGW-Firmicutes-11]
MTKEEIRARMREVREEKATFIKKADASDDVSEIRAINAKLDGLNDEYGKLEEQLYDFLEAGIEQRSGSPIGQIQILGTYGMATAKNQKIKNERAGENHMNMTPEVRAKFEQLGSELKERKAASFEIDEMELRAVTVASGDLVVPTHTSNTLAPAFNEVSALIDAVKAVPLPGGEAYEKGFVVSYGEGDYTDETSDYTAAEPTFDYVQIGKAKITAYAEMTDEAAKLPNVQYAIEVKKAIMQAIRKKISRQIVAGAGGPNALTGIFNAPENVIPAASDIEISKIDVDTLDNLVLAYGGDEEIEGDAFLILSKADLAAFAAIRDAEGNKIYKIKKTSGATGIISSDGTFETPYVLNSACPALTATETDAGTLCMAYGKLAAYEMPLFSQLTVEESRDFKFKSGHIAFRGSVWTGGNVAMYRGFVRIKKKA